MKPNRIGFGLATLLLVTGAGHFVVPDPLDQIVPPFLPFEPRFWTYLSGVAEITVALMLLVPVRFRVFGKPIKQLGIWSAFTLFVLVYPANIYMAIDWLDRPMPDPIVAIARLPLQFGLFYWCFKINDQLKNLSKR
jgi:uncharacterized membrane protein